MGRLGADGVGSVQTSVGGGHSGEARWQALTMIVQLVPKKTCAGASTWGHRLPVVLELHHPAPGKQPSKPTHSQPRSAWLAWKQLGFRV